MAPPGGARAVISARTQSRFNVLNLTVPNDSQVSVFIRHSVAILFHLKNLPSKQCLRMVLRSREYYRVPLSLRTQAQTLLSVLVRVFWWMISEACLCRGRIYCFPTVLGQPFLSSALAVRVANVLLHFQVFGPLQRDCDPNKPHA